MREFGPDVHAEECAFIHPSALVYGKVTLGSGSSMWPYSVIRAEAHEVVVGDHTNIQDFVMIHIGDRNATRIGSYCSLAHRSVVHGAIIGDNTLIGIGAIVLEGAKIGNNCLIAAGSVVTEGAVVPDDSLVVGTPGRVIKKRNNYVANRLNAELYYRNAQAFTIDQHRAWSGPDFPAQIHATMRRLQKDLTED